MTTIHQYVDQLSKKTWLFATNQKASASEISVVVPVYNGYEALKACVQSILDFTCSSVPIVFLDDASTDQRVNQLLSATAQKHPQVHVINQPKNLGYLKNVNSYLAQCSSEVILLNSDTRVTTGWLTEMQFVAADSRVGAVCPLSNHATLLTINHSHPYHLEQLRQYSGQWYPIPTAVGFCMLIKQSVIKKMGGFDPYYCPGYGEECDYSMLIRQMDLQVACAPAAFVFHQGSQSFGTASDDLQKTHQKLLDLRWPQYTSEVTLFQSKNPTKLIDLNLKNGQISKPKILHVLHGIDNKGGVELFTKELISRFDDQFHHTVLIPQRNNKFKTKAEKLGFDVLELDTLVHRPEHVVYHLPADLYHQDYDLFFQNILLAGHFDLVHFHSLIGVGTVSWPLICHKFDIPYHLFIHDHFGLCQIYTLSSNANKKTEYCGEVAMQLESKKCQQCMVQNTQKAKLTTDSFMSLRQEIWEQIISHAAYIYFPSDYLQSAYLNQYPDILDKASVFKPCFYANKVAPCKPFDESNIHIAFVGQFSELKGAQLFIDLFHRVGNKKINWHVFGGIEPKFKPQLANTSIQCHGQYESHELAVLLKDIDLVVLPSVFPETYGITLTEAWTHGKTVLAADIGAYKGRVKDGINGNLFKFNDADSLKQSFDTWLQQQSSGLGFKTIQYQEQAENNPSLLLSKYQESLKNKKIIPTQQGELLKKPGPSAWDLMQLWLNSPMTLEAAADWQEPPKNMPVIILGNDSKAVKSTVENIGQYFNEPIIYMVGESIQQSEITGITSPALIMAAGTLINDNIGNWIKAFIEQKHSISTADHALHNQNLQSYHTQFQQRFSQQNHSISQPFTACILSDPMIFKDDLMFDALTSNNINRIIEHWIKTQQQNIYHFPYHCYTKNDVQWAYHWKQKLAIKSNKPKKSPQKVLLLLESNFENAVTQLQLSQQSILTGGQASLISFKSAEKQSVLNKIDLIRYDCVALLNDNLRFSNDDVLAKIILQLKSSCLDVISPVSENSNNQGILAGKKWGASNHFVGVGRVRDVRFDQQESAFEYDILDDDIIVLKQTAFKAIKEKWLGLVGHYDSLYITNWLRKAEFATGLCFAKGLHKKGIPSKEYETIDNSLQQQRQQIIEQNLHTPHQPVYAQAYSCRQSSQLEVNLSSFKTPKNLPRIVAYAHDDWASGFYRVKAPLSALAANNHASVHFLPSAKKELTATAYEIMKFQADCLLLHHFLTDQQLAALLQYKKQTTIRIILGFDDLLTGIPEYSPLAKSMPTDIETRLKLACSMADGIIVSTNKLAKEFAAFHHNIQVIPNRLSKTIWQGLHTRQTHQQKLRIGWAGAGQHQQDLLFLKPIVEATSKMCDWVFFGDKPKEVDAKHYQFHPAVNLLEYPEKLSRLKLDVAVAPLVDNSFNQAKSNLKLLEFGVLGIPVMASDLSPYQNSPAILLQNQAKGWIDKIQQLNDNRALIEQHGHDLQQWVNQHFILEDHMQDWLKVLL